MKVAIPVFKSRVSPRIDVSDSLLVYDIHNGVLKQKVIPSLAFDYPAELVSFLQKNNIKQVICGGCPQFFLRALLFYGFDVAAGLSGDPGHIMKLFVEGKLKNLPLCYPDNPFGRRCSRRRRTRKRNK
jgi:predicted Fe-Mo cluster-binding NifX family protein